MLIMHGPRNSGLSSCVVIAEIFTGETYVDKSAYIERDSGR